MSAEEEWKVVTKDDRKRVARRRGRGRHPPRAQVHTSLGTLMSSVQDDESLFESLASCKKLLRETKAMIQSLSLALDEAKGEERSMRQLVCYEVWSNVP